MTKRWPITNCSGLSTSEFESNKVIIEQRLFKNNQTYNTVQQICALIQFILEIWVSSIRNFAVPRGKHQQNKYAFVNVFFWIFPFLFSPACKIEVPERLTVCAEALERTGLAHRCVSIPVREAADADILLVHRSVLSLYRFSFYSSTYDSHRFLKILRFYIHCCCQQWRVFRSSEENSVYDFRGS